MGVDDLRRRLDKLEEAAPGETVAEAAARLDPATCAEAYRRCILQPEVPFEDQVGELDPAVAAVAGRVSGALEGKSAQELADEYRRRMLGG